MKQLNSLICDDNDDIDCSGCGHSFKITATNDANPEFDKLKRRVFFSEREANCFATGVCYPSGTPDSWRPLEKPAHPEGVIDYGNNSVEKAAAAQAEIVKEMVTPKKGVTNIQVSG